MVTRKPVAQAATAGGGAPTAQSSQETGQDMWSAPDSGDNADQVWASERQDQINGDNNKPRSVPPEDIPDALRPGMPPPANYSSLETEENVWGDSANSPAPIAGETEQQGAKTDVNRVPTVLRPGGGAMRPETNPFKRKPPGSVSSPRKDTTVEPPSSSLAQLSVEDTDANPWEPAVEQSKPGAPPPPVVTVTEPESGKDIWDSGKPSRQPSPGPAAASPGLVSMPSETGSAVWDEKQPARAPTPEEKIALGEEQELEDDSHIWDDLGALDKGKGPEKQPPAIPSQSAGGRIDEWNLVDHDEPPPAPLKRKDTWEIFDETPDAEDGSAPPQPTPEEQPPTLPPRTSTEQMAAQPTSATQPPRQVPEPKNQTYQIKVINWHDEHAARNPRQSPILVQNANGPCPLVALVNALTLTTPADMETALVDTLRSREQVSLDLVIQAVFEELMSRRNGNGDLLPDVPELFGFLKGLHTGMNVNPRFIPTEDIVVAFKRTSLTHLHPTERSDSIPGTFEETREMTLYSTFRIPLIHGWLPPKTDAVYAALERRAASYEDVQNLLFMEEELEDKLSSPHHQGLTEEEQQVYQDIFTIKSFLNSSATQLTRYGLQTIQQAMKPGSVAILFRNDHFSTLYRHPQTHELLTLVTDAGYASHDEVVWESLVDVNGEHAEFFSGDFRLVGGASHHIDHDSVPARGSSSADSGAWTTVHGRRGRTQTQANPSDTQAPLSPTHEQEDRDLALAMQLQEEEDERARAEQARRRRESQLSEQFIEQQGRQPAGRNPPNGGGRGNGRNGNNNNNNSPRRSSNNLVPIATNASTTSVNSRSSANNNNRGGRGAAPPQSQTVRSLIPPRGGVAVNRRADEGEDEAPPSYEQAAKAPVYVPPADGGGNGGASASASASASSATAAVAEATRRRTSSAAAAAQRPSMLAPGGPVPASASGQPGIGGRQGGPLRQGSTSNYPGAYSGSPAGRSSGGTPTGQRIQGGQGIPMAATRADGRDEKCVVM